jgi:Subtilase family
VHAADAAGGQIAETITDGYQTAAAATPGSSPGAGGTGPAAAIAAPGSSPSPGGPAQLPPPVPGDGPMRAACPPPRPGHAQCFALYARQVRVNAARAAGVTGAPTVPVGWGARDIESAYKLPVSRNPHQTVAVVDAYRTPALAANLAVYRQQYGLPACTRASGCLRIVNQQGKASPLPPSGVPTGWDVETMLDVSMVSAACPRCHILVVEASSDSFADLAAAENTAARLGAQAISNSYGIRENGQAQAYAAAYDHPGHTIVVSSGDDGFTAANFPANLASVTAAGGTELARAHNARGWSERVWLTPFAGASGSGCSAYVAKPSWQRDRHCPGRTVADVSALAWNVPIYEKVQGGWLTVGGTSASAPLIAGVYGLAGNAATVKPGHPYARPGSLFDITVGNNDFWNQANGASCGHDYLCTAKKGYDAPTGLGTPDGTGAF